MTPDARRSLEALIAKWRRSCELTRVELLTIRKNNQEGPRYGIAAVESCADELEAAVQAVEEPPRLAHQISQQEPDGTVVLTVEEPSVQPSYLTVELLNRAKAIVNNSVLYRRFIDGTPLENDIAVWMADFAGAMRHEHTEHVKEFLNELYAVMVDPCAEGTIAVDEMKRQLLAAAIRDRDAVEARRPAEPDKEQRAVSLWVTHPFDVEDPACVCCGTSLYLRDECEWDDDPDYNLCVECAITLLKQPTSQSAEPDGWRDRVLDVLNQWQALVNFWYAEDALEHLGGNIIKKLGHETDAVVSEIERRPAPPVPRPTPEEGQP